jgi:hypothetical protein
MSDAGDPFHLIEVAALQAGLLAYLKDDPLDMSIKIAALRATADLFQQSVAVAVLTRQVEMAITPAMPTTGKTP